MGIFNSGIGQSVLQGLLGANPAAGTWFSESAATSEAKSPVQESAPNPAAARAVAQTPTSTIEKSAQRFAAEAPKKMASPFPKGSAEELEDFLLSDAGQALDGFTRSLGWLEVAGREGDLEMKLIAANRAYQEAWNDLDGEQRTAIRQVHANLIVGESKKAAELYKNSRGTALPGMESLSQPQWVNQHFEKMALAQSKILQEAAFTLSQDWQVSLSQGQEIPAGHSEAQRSVLRIGSMTELCAFQASVGLGKDPRDGRVKVLGAQVDETGQTALESLTAEIAKFAEPGNLPSELVQYEMSVYSANRLLESGHATGAVRLLDPLRHFDGSALSGDGAEELKRVRLGAYQIYQRAQRDIQAQLDQYPEDLTEKNLETLANLARLDPNDAQLHDVHQLKWALEIARQGSEKTALRLTQENHGEFKEVAQVLYLMEQGRVDDAAQALQQVLQSEISDPMAASVAQNLEGIIHPVLDRSLARQSFVVSEFARSQIEDEKKMARIERGLDVVEKYVQTLDAKDRPAELNQAIAHWFSDPWNSSNLEDHHAMAQLRDFIDPSKNPLGNFLQADREEALQTLPSLLDHLANLDQSSDIEAALKELEVVLGKDADYLRGDSSMEGAITQTSSLLLAHAPTGSHAGHRVAGFRAQIHNQETRRHTYNEWILLVATAPIGLGAGAAGVKAGEFVTARIVSNGLMGAKAARWVGAATGLGVEAGIVWGAQYPVNYAVETMSSVDLPEQGFLATLIDVGAAHVVMRRLGQTKLGESAVARSLGGAMTMTASGQARVEMQKFLPEWMPDLALEGEDHLNAEDFTKNFFLSLFLDTGAAWASRRSARKGPPPPQGGKGRGLEDATLRGSRDILQQALDLGYSLERAQVIADAAASVDQPSLMAEGVQALLRKQAAAPAPAKKPTYGFKEFYQDTYQGLESLWRSAEAFMGEWTGGMGPELALAGAGAPAPRSQGTSASQGWGLLHLFRTAEAAESGAAEPKTQIRVHEDLSAGRTDFLDYTQAQKMAYQKVTDIEQLLFDMQNQMGAENFGLEVKFPRHSNTEGKNFSGVKAGELVEMHVSLSPNVVMPKKSGHFQNMRYVEGMSDSSMTLIREMNQHHSGEVGVYTLAEFLPHMSPKAKTTLERLITREENYREYLNESVQGLYADLANNFIGQAGDRGAKVAEARYRLMEAVRELETNPKGLDWAKEYELLSMLTPEQRKTYDEVAGHLRNGHHALEKVSSFTEEQLFKALRELDGLPEVPTLVQMNLDEATAQIMAYLEKSSKRGGKLELTLAGAERPDSGEGIILNYRVQGETTVTDPNSRHGRSIRVPVDEVISIHLSMSHVQAAVFSLSDLG